MPKQAKSIRVTFSLDIETQSTLRKLSKERHQTMSQIIRDLVFEADQLHQ